MVLHTLAVDLTGPPHDVAANIGEVADWIAERSRETLLAVS